MIKYKNNTRFAGAMFLLAMIASLTGGSLIQSVLDKPDFIILLSNEKRILITGIVLEFINAFAVIGIAIVLRAPLKKASPLMTVGYFGFRVIEIIACVVAAFIPIIIMTLSSQETDVILFADNLNIIRTNIISYAVPIFFGVGGFIFNIILYRAHLVPKYLAVWGIIAAPAVMLNMVIPVSAIKPFFALPIIVNEIYLGIYLIIKGFQDSTSTINK